MARNIPMLQYAGLDDANRNEHSLRVQLVFSQRGAYVRWNISMLKYLNNLCSQKIPHSNNMKQTRRRKKQAAIGRPSFAVIFIEMWNIMSSAVSTKLPHSSSERIFMTACLLVNVIISGSFQVRFVVRFMPFAILSWNF